MKQQAIRKHITLLLIACFFFAQLPAQSTYSPETNLRNDIREHISKTLQQYEPQPTPALLKLIFSNNQCFRSYEKVTRKYQWPPYQGPTALAFREIVLTEIVEGREFSDTQVKEMYEKTKATYLAANTDADLKNEALQRKYDPMILEGLWTVTLYKLAKKHQAAAQKLARKLLTQKAAGVPTKDAPPILEEKQPEDKPAVSIVDKTEKPAPPGLATPAPIVEDIILRTVTSYGLSGAYIENEVSVLFKNGSLLTNPSRPLSQLDVRQSKREHPKKWATWQRQGNVLAVHKAWKNKSYEWKKWFELRSGKKGARLNGQFKTADAFSGAAVINASTVQFDQSGRFAWKTIKGGNTSWKPIYSQSESAGTYTIDDYSIQLTYNNGKSESFFFGFYPKDDAHFVIGSRHFTPVK